MTESELKEIEAAGHEEAPFRDYLFWRTAALRLLAEVRRLTEEWHGLHETCSQRAREIARLVAERDALVTEKATLREALEWYAMLGPNMNEGLVLWDGGATARAALEGK